MRSRSDFGAIVTPVKWRNPPEGVEWCADNGAFGKNYPGEPKWFAWLSGLPFDRSRCAFAVAPDVVGDAAATLERSLPWLDKIRSLGLPVAFVAQDGIESTALPWSDFDVLFIGGSTEFKLGDTARRYAGTAVEKGKAVHMGRVNSLRRMRIAKSFGCSSSDGTVLAFGPDVNVHRVVRWLTEINRVEGAMT